MPNFNKDESCKLVQSLLTNVASSSSVTSSRVSILHFWAIHTSRTCYNKMMQFITQFKFLALRHRPHYQLKTRNNLLASCQLCSTSIIAHVFCRRCFHSSKPLLPHLVFYCVAFGMASDTRPVSSSLLFGEPNQPTSHVSTTKAISK